MLLAQTATWDSLPNGDKRNWENGSAQDSTDSVPEGEAGYWETTERRRDDGREESWRKAWKKVPGVKWQRPAGHPGDGSSRKS